MNIIIIYRDGSTATYTDCSDLDATWPGPVKFTGTDPSGAAATWFIPWDIIKILGQQLP